MKREVAVVIAAEACVRSPRIQRVIGIVLARELHAHLERGVSRFDAGTDRVLHPTVCAGVEVAAGACLNSIASSLHVPKERLAQCYGCVLVCDIVAEPRDIGNGNRAERRQRTQRNHLRRGSGVLGTHRCKVSCCGNDYNDGCCDPEDPQQLCGWCSHLLHLPDCSQSKIDGAHQSRKLCVFLLLLALHVPCQLRGAHADRFSSLRCFPVRELSVHCLPPQWYARADRKSTRLNSSHGYISYAVFCLEK